MCFCTTNFWAKYLIFSPQIEANNVLTPLQCFSPSGPNHTLTCTAWRGQKKHPNLFASRQITKNLPYQGRKCSPSSLIHALIIQSYKSSMSSCSEGDIEENYKFVKTSKKKKCRSFVLGEVDEVHVQQGPGSRMLGTGGCRADTPLCALVSQAATSSECDTGVVSPISTFSHWWWGQPSHLGQRSHLGRGLGQPHSAACLDL